MSCCPFDVLAGVKYAGIVGSTDLLTAVHACAIRPGAQ